MRGEAQLVPLLALLAGCPSPPPQIRQVDHHGRAQKLTDADELLRRVTETNDGYGTLSAMHRVTAEIALGGERSEKRTFRGALAIRRPEHFRLQILGAMGVKLVDLLFARGKLNVIHVERALQRSSRLPAILGSIAGDIRAIYRLDPRPRVERRSMDESVALASGNAPLYDLKEYRAGELVRQMDVFASTLAVARSQVVEGTEIRTVTYGDYETDGKLMIPRQIHVAKEGSVFYWLSIRVESVSIDEELDEKLFVIDRAEGNDEA